MNDTNMLVFVYGTLMSGFRNNYLLDNSKFIGADETVDKFGLYKVKHGDFPFAIDSEKLTHLLGEVYKVDEYTMQMLDTLENYPELYIKKEIEVIVNNKRLKAIIYLKNENNYKDVIDYEQQIEIWD